MIRININCELISEPECGRFEKKNADRAEASFFRLPGIKQSIVIVV